MLLRDTALLMLLCEVASTLRSRATAEDGRYEAQVAADATSSRPCGTTKHKCMRIRPGQCVGHPCQSVQISGSLCRSSCPLCPSSPLWPLPQAVLTKQTQARHALCRKGLRLKSNYGTTLSMPSVGTRGPAGMHNNDNTEAFRATNGGRRASLVPDGGPHAPRAGFGRPSPPAERGCARAAGLR